MSRKLEIELEKRIFRAAVDDLLAAGYALGLSDGEERVVKKSLSPDEIVAAAFTTDDEELYAVDLKTGEDVGWVKFIWGNVEDCLSDYTTNLEEALKPANALAETYR